MRKALGWVGLGVVWAGAISVGAQKLLRYEGTPGQLAAPGPQWPQDSGLVRSGEQFTLVVFAHPDCPCTRATLAELGIVEARLAGRVKALVEFVKPEATSSEVRSSSLWAEAESIPGASAGFDAGAREAHLFAATTSGQALLYNPQGRLVFTGGITAARGHEGDNDGVAAVIALASGRAAPSRNPVFGCSLLDPGPAELSKDPEWKKR